VNYEAKTEHSYRSMRAKAWSHLAGRPITIDDIDVRFVSDLGSFYDHECGYIASFRGTPLVSARTPDAAAAKGLAYARRTRIVNRDGSLTFI
jgi:hypothetical protein